MYLVLGKRLFDIAASAAGIVLCLPLLLACAAAIVLDSGPPVFFRQERMGEKGKPFLLVKFRTMRADRARERLFEPGERGRVTRAGAVLRKLKLDELPQLLNVLRGEMSMVGPRPEVPKYRSVYAGCYAAVLAVKPGITDAASIKYRDEEELLAASGEPERLYRETILPDKLGMNLSYIERKATFRDDLAVILGTLARLVR